MSRKWKPSHKQRGVLKLVLDQSVEGAGVYFGKFNASDLAFYDLNFWDTITITSLVKRGLLIKRKNGLHILSDEGRKIAGMINEYPLAINKINRKL